MMRLTTSITTCVAIVFLLTYQPHRSIKVCHAQSRIAWPLKRNPFKKSNKTNHRLVVSAEEEIPSKGRRDTTSEESEEYTYQNMKHSIMDACELSFESISMNIDTKKKNRVILDGSIRGYAKPGRMLAIMGPSGSGKTSLLMSLAGKMKSNGSVQLSGSRYVNGIPVPEDGILPSAFVRQEVNFFPHMTVKETLDFRVDLKVGKTLGKSARDDIVKDLMETLALTKSANTIVGNSKIRGISGGERKRLSIACEMISSPPMIFLDEPTTGLDSFQATQVCRTLRNLADSGKTIIAVIHQPSQTAFALFDDLLLLSEGQQMYFGETSKARSYFQSLGYAPVTDVGTAEFVSDVISTTYSGGTGDREIDIARCNDIAIKGKEQSQRIKLSNVDQSVTSKATQKIFDNFKSLSFRKPAANIFKQFRLLMVRSLQEVFRGKATLLIKVTQQITLGLIYGGIYQLGNNQASIQDRVGLLSLVAIGITNMAVAGTIRSFPKEKVIVTEEMSSGLYGTFPYFVAKAISEIPPVALFSAAFSCVLYPLTGLQPEKFVTFLGLTTLHSIASEGVGLMIGAVSASADIALALFPPLIVLNIIFDGKNISEESTPKLLRWIPKIGLIKNTFEGLVLNEFSGLEFESSGFRGPAAKNGAEALARFGITTTVKNVMKAQVTLIAGSWLLSFVGLSLTKDKFQVMKRP